MHCNWAGPRASPTPPPLSTTHQGRPVGQSRAADTYDAAPLLSGVTRDYCTVLDPLDWEQINGMGAFDCSVTWGIAQEMVSGW
jgi:hypothetical protein